MTTLADSWSISIGGGWIVLMLVGMALCFVFMVGFMSFMRGGRGWSMCGQRWQQWPRTDTRVDKFVRSPEPPASSESEA